MKLCLSKTEHAPLFSEHASNKKEQFFANEKVQVFLIVHQIIHLL